MEGDPYQSEVLFEVYDTVAILEIRDLDIVQSYRSRFGKPVATPVHVLKRWRGGSE